MLGHLSERTLRLDAVVIGGAALSLLGVVSRPTRDCDILHPALPQDRDDLRIAAVLATWFGVHASWVNADWMKWLPSIATR